MLAGIEVGRERGRQSSITTSICVTFATVSLRSIFVCTAYTNPEKLDISKQAIPLVDRIEALFGMCIVESTIERDDGMPDWTFKHFNLSAYTFLFEMQIPIGDRSYCSKQLDTFRLQQLCNH